MSSRFRNLLLTLAGIAVPAIAGCTDARSPVLPAAPGGETSARSVPSSRFATGSELDVLARYRAKPRPVSILVYSRIGPAGGRMDFQGFSIIVPRNAVDRTTTFWIYLPEIGTSNADRVVAEFGPHGVPFRRQVTIGLPYRGTTVEGDPGASVVWWDNGTWVPMGGTISADGSQLLIPTPHFSEYGTASMARGGTFLTSGG
jgi:hypothetical protein